MKEEMVRANCFDMLAVLTNNFDTWIKAGDIVRELKRNGLKTDTRTIAEFSKELRANGYRVVSNKANCYGYCITEDREKIAHFERMQNSHIEALKAEQEVTWKLLDTYDKEFKIVPCQR